MRMYTHVYNLEEKRRIFCEIHLLKIKIDNLSRKS